MHWTGMLVMIQILAKLTRKRPCSLKTAKYLFMVEFANYILTQYS